MGYDLLLVESYDAKTTYINGRMFIRKGNSKNAFTQSKELSSFPVNWIQFNKVVMAENSNKTWALVGEPRLEAYVDNGASQPASQPDHPVPTVPERSSNEDDDKSVADLPKPNYRKPKLTNPILEGITKAHHAREVFGFTVNAKVSVKQLTEAYKILQNNMKLLHLRQDEEARRTEATAKLDAAMEILKLRFGNQKPAIMEGGVVENSQGQFEMNSQNMMFDQDGFCCEMGDCPTYTGGEAPTIMCSGNCENWFHFDCLKIGDQAKLDLLIKEDSPFLCRKCIAAKPKQGGEFELWDPDDEQDSVMAKFVQDRVSDCRMSPKGVVEFKLHWFDTERETEGLAPVWVPFEKVKYTILEDYYEIISGNVEKFDAAHDEVVPATPKEITACRVRFHTSLPNKRIPFYRVDWANQKNDVEDWRPTWDLNWKIIAEYHLNKEGISETEEELPSV